MTSDSVLFQIKLSKAVEKHPCLYDYHLKDYSNRDKVQMTWEIVAQEVDSTVKRCREIWRHMRVVFTRNIKKSLSEINPRKKSWPVLQQMMFLKSYVNFKKCDLPRNVSSSPLTLKEEVEDIIVTEIQGADDNPDKPCAVANSISHEPLNWSVENEEPSISIESVVDGGTRSPRMKKKKVKEIDVDGIVVDYFKSKLMNSTENNPRRLFLLSLLPDLDSMTSAQFRNFRVEVVNLIDLILASYSSSTPSPCSSNL